MTQAELKMHRLNKSGRNTNNEEITTANSGKLCITENCIQILAWVLLALGLCIIVTTFYLAKFEIDNNNNNSNNNNSEIIIFDNTDSIDVFMEFNKTARINGEYIIGEDKSHIEGCEERFCKIACIKSVDLFRDLNNTFHLSKCTSTDVLLIRNQQFPRAILKNEWISFDRCLYEIIISSSNVTRILSNAFNSPLFSETFFLSWHKLRLEMVGSGSLLGLHSLRILDIRSKISKLDRAFFQPVQTTLTTLKINAGLIIAKDQNIFGISYLEKLEYADLSDNTFSGPLTKTTFTSTPNIRYLHIRNSQITSITNDAFDHLDGKLYILNLSRNLLTTISSNVLSSLLNVNKKAFISLGSNNWLCNCDIRSLAYFYTNYRNQFLDTLYCKAPHELYGTLLSEVNLLQCDTATSTGSNFAVVDDNALTFSTTSHPVTKSIDLNEQETSGMNSLDEDNKILKMRCSNIISPDSSRSQAQTVNGFISSEKYGGKSLDLNYNQKSDVDYFRFNSPTHRLLLTLFRNRSVEIVVEDFSKLDLINIIWFKEPWEDFEIEHIDTTINYTCLEYINPFFVSNLVENATYTFCLLPVHEASITPFNCLPLHVPKDVKSNHNVWISKDEKQFTVAMMCLMFMLSTFFGGIVAYFGIKTYPDLLEGSKNVLIVKKTQKSLYISTIFDTGCTQMSSLTKEPSLRNSMTSKKHISSSPQFGRSVKTSDSLSSEQSSSTYFKDAFKSILEDEYYLEDEYELPKRFEPHQMSSERCIPNRYATSPCMPPPLPKRNSTVFEQ